MKVLLLLIFPVSLAFADLQIEYLSTNSNYNYFSLPNANEQNRVDMPKDISGQAIRLFYESKISTWSWTLLYAPLSIDYNFNSDKNFTFNNTNFSTNTSTSVNYKFNSYRLGYRRNIGKKFNRLYYGALIKIRDARLCVSQGISNDCYDNIGPVPLLNLGFEKTIGSIFMNFNLDGLYSSKGSAYDANVELGLNTNIADMGFGVRMLGGGADNETLINFAQFQSFYLKLIF